MTAPQLQAWRALCPAVLPRSNVAEAEFREFLEAGGSRRPHERTLHEGCWHLQELKNGCHTARGRFVPAPHVFDFAKALGIWHMGIWSTLLEFHGR